MILKWNSSSTCKLNDKTMQFKKDLRRKLEEKSQELAPVQQKRRLFKAALHTANTVANLVEDKANWAREQLLYAENELEEVKWTAEMNNNCGSRRKVLTAVLDPSKKGDELF